MGLNINPNQNPQGSQYETLIDSLYRVYNATLKEYPIANAFVDGSDVSVAKWGLQSSNRTNQNNLFKGQYVPTILQGTGALSAKSITYQFARTLASLDTGNIQSNFYQAGLPTIQINETTKKIGSVKMVNFNTNIGGDPMSFVATSGGNKYLINCDGANLRSYSLDANYCITGLAQTLSAFGGQRTWIIGAKNQYVWAVGVDYNATVAYQMTWYAQLYSMNSAGLLTAVGAKVTLIANSQPSQQYISQNCGTLSSYIVNNVCHLHLDGWFYGNYGGRNRTYLTVDLNTVTVFTFTQIRNEQINQQSGGIYSYFGYGGGRAMAGYDGTQMLIVTNLGTSATPDIYSVSAGATWTDTTKDALTSYSMMMRYTKNATLMSTANSNWYFDTANTMKILGTSLNGSFTNLYAYVIFMYEMTGSNEQDASSALKGLFWPCMAIGENDGIFKLKLNGADYLSKDYRNKFNFSASDFNWTLTKATLNSKKLIFELIYENLGATDCKMGFSLNGGSYASPTGGYETSVLNLTFI